MASGDTLLVCAPLANQPPSLNFAQFASLNTQPTFNFPPSVTSSMIFPGVMPANYAGGGITVTVFFTTDALPASHNIIMAGGFERNNVGADMTSDNFSPNQSMTLAAPTLGQMQIATFAFTNGSQMAGILVNERFRFRIQRLGGGSDNFTGNVQFLGALLKET